MADWFHSHARRPTQPVPLTTDHHWHRLDRSLSHSDWEDSSSQGPCPYGLECHETMGLHSPLKLPVCVVSPGHWVSASLCLEAPVNRENTLMGYSRDTCSRWYRNVKPLTKSPYLWHLYKSEIYPGFRGCLSLNSCTEDLSQKWCPNQWGNKRNLKTSKVLILVPADPVRLKANKWTPWSTPSSKFHFCPWLWFWSKL